MTKKQIAPVRKPAQAPVAPPAPAKRGKPAPVPEPVAARGNGTSGSRGPRGTTEDAVITLLVDENPKRVGSKASGYWEQYQDGMTVGEYIDAVDSVEELRGGATPSLVYDASHGFIEIEGYDPTLIVAKPKNVKVEAPAPAKAKAKTKRGAKEPEPDEQLDVQEETIDGNDD